MACTGLNLGTAGCGNGCNNCSGGTSINSCMWTLIIIAAILVWLNCGCSFGRTGITACA